MRDTHDLMAIYVASKTPKRRDYITLIVRMTQAGSGCSAAIADLQQRPVPTDLVALGAARWRDEAIQGLVGVMDMWHTWLIHVAIGAPLPKETSTVDMVWKDMSAEGSEYERIAKRLGLWQQF